MEQSWTFVFTFKTMLRELYHRAIHLDTHVLIFTEQRSSLLENTVVLKWGGGAQWLLLHF